MKNELPRSKLRGIGMERTTYAFRCKQRGMYLFWNQYWSYQAWITQLPHLSKKVPTEY